MIRSLLTQVSALLFSVVLVTTITSQKANAQCDGHEVIGGELGLCETGSSITETYTVLPLGPGVYTWSISGGGTITSTNPTSSNSVTIDWNGTQGTETVTYAYEIGGVTCMQSFDVSIVPANLALACNNTVNLSLNSNCELEVLPDMLLEGVIYANGAYEIVLTDVEADTTLSSNMVGAEYVGKNLIAEVRHTCSGNSCWGNVRIEDKNIPQLVCADDITLTCSDDSSPVFDGFASVGYNSPATGSGINTNVNWPLTGSGTAVITGSNSFSVMADDLCGVATLTYQDSIGALDCSDPAYSSIIYRKWTISSGSGASNTCTDIIHIAKPDLANIVWPANLDGADALRCDERVAHADEIVHDDSTSWVALDSGYPDPHSPNYDLYPSGVESNCERLKFSYTDDVFDDCGTASYKLKRTWLVIDWCTSEIATHDQLIRVVNSGTQIVLNAPVEFEVPAFVNCSASFDVPPVNIISQGCSPIASIKVGYKVAEDALDCVERTFIFDGVRENRDGTFTIPNVDRPTDMIWIGYLVTNECGQSEMACTEAKFVDGEEPVAVCDQETVVALNVDGMAWAGPLAFDDGSWDNCGVDHFEIMKVTGSDCGETRVFGDKIKFCCEDIGEKVQVLLKVVDKGGFENVCKSWVEVQDNFAPRVISCPGDRDVECPIDLDNLSRFGTPEIEGVCDSATEEDVSVNLNDCGIGTVTRTWRSISNTAVLCRQVLSVGASNPFSRADITFPEDISLNSCAVGSNLDPANLPTANGFPTFSDRTCSKISYDYEDVILQGNDEACIKILREWKVLDWCQYANDITTGSFNYTQVIKLSDDVDPVINSACNNIVIDDAQLDDNCQTPVELKVEGSDDCSTADQLIWRHTLEDLSTGRQTSGNGNDASGTYSIGSYRITWTLTDLCGNTATCSQMLTIVDSKPPTPYCFGDLVSVLNQNTKSVTIWASDFVTGVADNCGPKEDDVTVAFSEDPNDTNLTVECADFIDGRYAKDLRVYAIDAAGNSTYCDTRLIVQDNRDLCGFGDTTGGGDGEGEGEGEGETETDSSSLALIAGHIFTPQNKMVNDVEVNIYGDATAYSNAMMTEQEGEFAFPGLEMYKDYMVEPIKEDLHVNGVSTLDLVLIQKHILGLKSFDDPYKAIAADANNSGSVSAVDLVQLRKLILGLYEELPNNSSWRFVDADQEFTNIGSPFPFDEQISYSYIDADQMNTDFIAVKIGDVNASVKTNNLDQAEVRSREIKSLKIGNSLRKDNRLMIPVSSTESGALVGMQFTLEIGREMKFLGIAPKQLDVQQDNFALIGQNTLTFSWFTDAEDFDVDADEELFYLIVEPLRSDIELEDNLAISSSITAAEYYASASFDSNESFDLQLVFDGESSPSPALSELKVYQNAPNPFTEETKVAFDLPEESTVTFRIIDLTGKVVREQTDFYPKGRNEILVNTKNINTQGILYYQVETSKHIATMKMIVLK